MTRSELKRRLQAAEDRYRKSLSSMTDDELNEHIQTLLSKLNLPHPVDVNSMSLEELEKILSHYI